MFQEALTFDDVILEPQYSEVLSRTKPNLDSKLPIYNTTFSLPIISSPMDTVTEVDMAVTMSRLGGLGLIHRYNTIQEQVGLVEGVVMRETRIGEHIHRGAAIGTAGDYLERAEALFDAGTHILCIDVAHGHHLLVKNAIRALREKFGNNVHIMAGNVATARGFADLAEWGADSIRVGIGGGCLTGETRILMSNGRYKNIKDIKVGDYVINSEGKKVKVSNVINSGFKKVMKTRNSLFYKKTFITPEHKIWQYNLNSIKDTTLASHGYKKSVGNKKPHWLNVGDCERRNVALMPKNISFDLQDTFNVDGLVPTYELGYVFGTFLGDGNAQSGEYYIPSRGRKQKQGRCCWYFGKEEKDIANKLSSCVLKALGEEAKIKEQKNTTNVYLFRKRFADLFAEFGKKTNKHLPEKFWCSNKEYLSGIYDGLMDSDGTTGIRYSFSNTSPELVELFNIIVYLLKGYFPNNLNRGKQIGGLKNCNVDNLSESFVSRELKCPERRQNEEYQFVKILEKEAVVIEMETFDIEVECPTHSFIANNMIVHNSICSTRLNTGHGIPNLSSIQACYEVFKGHGPALIIDGGIRGPGDIVKAMAAGADFVMCGSLLAGTDEAPGEVLNVDGKKVKEYRGMASREAQHAWRGTSSAAEGISTIVPYKGPVKPILEDLSALTKAGLSYSGARNIEDFREKAKFVKQSAASVAEAYTHILNR